MIITFHAVEDYKATCKEDEAVEESLVCQKEFSIEEQFKRKLTFAESAQGISEEETLQTMADQESNGQVSADGQVSVDADAEVVERPKKNQTPAEPPVTFREFNVCTIHVIRYVNLLSLKRN